MTDFLRKAAKLLRIVRHPSALLALRYRTAAAIEHETFLRLVAPHTIVDVGANVGQFSLIASILHPNARIFAFEPIPRAIKVCELLFANNSNVKVFRFAIGAQISDETLHVAGRDHSSSLLPISPLQVSEFSDTAEVARLPVRVRPLACVLTPSDVREPALLKIDVQGYELEVLKGCGSLLNQFNDIYAELSFVELYVGQPLCDDVIRSLADWGFHLAGVFNVISNSRGAPLQADFHFARNPSS